MEASFNHENVAVISSAVVMCIFFAGFFYCIAREGSRPTDRVEPKIYDYHQQQYPFGSAKITIKSNAPAEVQLKHMEIVERLIDARGHGNNRVEGRE